MCQQFKPYKVSSAKKMPRKNSLMSRIASKSGVGIVVLEFTKEIVPHNNDTSQVIK